MRKLFTGVVAGTLIVAGALLAVPVPAQETAKPGVYAEEDRDWGVPPRSQLRTIEYHAPTPRQIPGGRVIITGELSQMLEKEPRPYLIDVVGGDVHRTIAGAFWLTGAGAGDMSKDEERRFIDVLGKFAGGDKNRALVFFCVDSQCWLSYNAALRAIAAGYTNVMWYRGGVGAWSQAGLPMTMSDPFYW
jgi:PQQ-dependent catabolism-associated CXXCW motif protein